MNKSLEIFNRAVKESKGTNLIELANSKIQVIKESLERLEKLENIIDILKDEAYITIETDIDETGTEFHATLREKGGNGEIFIDEVTREECYLLKDVFGNENS